MREIPAVHSCAGRISSSLNDDNLLTFEYTKYVYSILNSLEMKKLNRELCQ
jgi:hypothetical protein